MKLQKDLRAFVELLIAKRVDFIIVGGHAVAYHGFPRFTGDIDIWVRPTIENGERLVDVLAAFGFGDCGVSASDFTIPERVVQLGTPPHRIDLLTSISAVEFSEAWDSRVNAALDGIGVSFLGRDALLRNKRAAGRAKDLADIEELESKP